MKVLLGRHRVLVFNKTGLRIHKSPAGTYFKKLEVQGEMMVSVHKEGADCKEEVGKIAAKIDQVTVDRALDFHFGRTEDLLKRVLLADTAYDAAKCVKNELESTRDRIEERQREKEAV